MFHDYVDLLLQALVLLSAHYDVVFRGKTLVYNFKCYEGMIDLEYICVDLPMHRRNKGHLSMNFRYDRAFLSSYSMILKVGMR